MGGLWEQLLANCPCYGIHISAYVLHVCRRLSHTHTCFAMARRAMVLEHLVPE